MVEVGKKTTLTLSEQSTEYHQDDQAAEQVQQIYDSMLEKYRGNKDKEQSAKDALSVYYVHKTFLERVAGVLQEIQDLVQLLEESLKDIQEQRDNQQAKTKRISKGSLVSKLVPCGKHCRGCPHGPYLYRVTKANGKPIWKYIGKASA